MNKKTKPVRTSILCAEHHERHTVTFHPDGTVTSSGCDDVALRAKRLASVARLRRKPIPSGGCVALVALVQHGIPQLLSQNTFDSLVDLGAWKDVYIRYETNKVVQAAADDVKRKRDAGHGDALTEARKAMRRTTYRRGWPKADIDECTSFLCDRRIKPGELVAVGPHDHFNVPLQSDWLETVAKAGIAVVSGKLVCGVDSDDPRRVYAVGKNPKTDFFEVRAYELQTKPTLRLKVA